MTISSNPFEAVRTRLDGGRKWRRGSLGEPEVPNASLCLMGACISVSFCQDRRDLNGFELIRQIGLVVGEQYPDRDGHAANRGEPWVPEFNDHPDTTWADVDLVLDKAARAWDETHGGAM